MKDVIWNWIKSHKFVIAVLVFILQALAVHALHKWYIGIPWLTAKWGPGDFLAYISSFEAFIGTVFLGLVSLEQSRKADEANRRLSEENINLQKIMSQKLIPVIQVCSCKVDPTKEGYRVKADFPGTQSFTRKTQFFRSIGYEFIVNIDVKDEVQMFKKEVSFSIQNISESIMRHICLDGIVVQGYKNLFLPTICVNQQPGNGISALLKADDQLKVKMTLYFKDEKIKEAWDCGVGGFSAVLYFTNTTITGVIFHEFVEIYVSKTGTENISYGEKRFEVGG